MRIDDDDDALILSTGKHIHCYRHTVGLRLDATGMDDRLFYGFDGVIPVWQDIDPLELNDADSLTPAECVELADFMLQQWAGFRHAALAKLPAQPFVPDPAFEAWAVKEGCSLTMKNGHYMAEETYDAWEGWQACKATAVAAERERCALLCENLLHSPDFPHGWAPVSEACAAAIRGDS